MAAFATVSAMWLLPVPGDPINRASWPSRNKFTAHSLIDFHLGELRIEPPIEFGKGGLFHKTGCFEARLGEAALPVIQFVLNQADNNFCQSRWSGWGILGPQGFRA